MFIINLDNHNLRQAELIQEAKKYRLILSLREDKSPSRGIARKIQGLISIIFLP